jgi:hypothetical protein
MLFPLTSMWVASTAWTGEALGDVLLSIEQFDLSNFADIFRSEPFLSSSNVR